jgi:NTE family protein
MTKALVLGGGGVAGVAWELGVLAGFAEAGLDLTEADLFIGTSAGAAAGAQITSGVPLAELYQAQIDGPNHEMLVDPGANFLLTVLGGMLRHRRDEVKFRKHIGKMALRASTPDEAVRREIIAARLPVHDWPFAPLKLTAVDAESGEFIVFDRSSGVSLVDAVAASCAVPGAWPCVTINGHRFMDGGLRSVAKADLAAGADQIIVIAPMTQGAGPLPSPVSQVSRLRAAGASVAVVFPDKAATASFGKNALDPAVRAPAAQAGHTQAASVVDQVRAIWQA